MLKMPLNLPLTTIYKEENFWIRHSSSFLRIRFTNYNHDHRPPFSPYLSFSRNGTHSGFGGGFWTRQQQRSELSELHVLHVPLVLRDPALGIAAGAVAAMVSRCHGKTNLKLPRGPTLPHSQRSMSCDPIHRIGNGEMLYQQRNLSETDTNEHSRIYCQVIYEDEQKCWPTYNEAWDWTVRQYDKYCHFSDNIAAIISMIIWYLHYEITVITSWWLGDSTLYFLRRRTLSSQSVQRRQTPSSRRFQRRHTKSSWRFPRHHWNHQHVGVASHHCLKGSGDIIRGQVNIYYSYCNYRNSSVHDHAILFLLPLYSLISSSISLINPFFCRHFWNVDENLRPY